MMRNQQYVDKAGLGSLRIIFGFLFLLVIWHQCRAKSLNYFDFKCRELKEPNCNDYGTVLDTNGCTIAYICAAQSGEECNESIPCARGLECRCNECRDPTNMWICPAMVKERLDQPHKRLPNRFPLWYQRARWQKLPQKYLEPEYKD